VEAAKLPTFLKFENAKKNQTFVLSLQNMIGGHETEGGWSKRGGTARASNHHCKLVSN